MNLGFILWLLKGRLGNKRGISSNMMMLIVAAILGILVILLAMLVGTKILNIGNIAIWTVTGD